jgi:hypothetical protein
MRELKGIESFKVSVAIVGMGDGKPIEKHFFSQNIESASNPHSLCLKMLCTLPAYLQNCGQVIND